MKDNRKKGCPNPECKKNMEHVLFKATAKYCVECATPLVFVCKDCFKKIEDLGPKHILCNLCEAKHKDDPMIGVKKTVKKGGCGECQTSCQSACKTSCTVGNQSCEQVK